MHHVICADIKNKIKSHPDKFAAIMQSPSWLFSMGGFRHDGETFGRIDELTAFVDESLWTVWSTSNVITGSKKFYEVCHCLYSVLGDSAGWMLLRKLEPMWELEGVIFHYEGVPSSSGRTSAMHPYMVASNWVQNPTAQQGAAMVSHIFHSLAEMPMQVIYRAFERIAVETDAPSRAAVLDTLFDHPIMTDFWQEAFLRNGSVPYQGVRSMSNCVDIYDAYLEKLYCRFKIHSNAPRTQTRNMGPPDPMDY